MLRKLLCFLFIHKSRWSEYYDEDDHKYIWIRYCVHCNKDLEIR